MTRKPYPERIRSALYHAINKIASDLNVCAKTQEKISREKGNFLCKPCY